MLLITNVGMKKKKKTDGQLKTKWVWLAEALNLQKTSPAAQIKLKEPVEHRVACIKGVGLFGLLTNGVSRGVGGSQQPQFLTRWKSLLKQRQNPPNLKI